MQALNKQKGGNKMTRQRDYHLEHIARTAANKRLLCDMNKEKAENFLKHLAAKNVTYSKWLQEQIELEMNK